ncbi:MAG: hypothetical protein LH616_13880 [Ilumatobacteraceae bacterium]|nr:hypothetical protein [Ilumatobacteraceae bacterium]
MQRFEQKLLDDGSGLHDIGIHHSVLAAMRDVTGSPVTARYRGGRGHPRTVAG